MCHQASYCLASWDQSLLGLWEPGWHCSPTLLPPPSTRAAGVLTLNLPSIMAPWLAGGTASLACLPTEPAQSLLLDQGALCLFRRRPVWKWSQTLAERLPSSRSALPDLILRQLPPWGDRTTPPPLPFPTIFFQGPLPSASQQ